MVIVSIMPTLQGKLLQVLHFIAGLERLLPNPQGFPVPCLDYIVNVEADAALALNQGGEPPDFHYQLCIDHLIFHG
jgi:hypothetical protein